MTNHTVSTEIVTDEINTSAIVIEGDDSILVEASGTLHAKQNGSAGIEVGSTPTSGVTEIVVAGVVKSDKYFAILGSLDGGMELTVGATGKVIASPPADSQTISRAILLSGHSIIRNSGYIYGYEQAIDFAIRSQNHDLKLYNTGLIEAIGSVIGGSWGADYIENKGSIKGETIDLLLGADTYDGRQGSTTCIINLGEGEDKAYGGIGQETFVGGKGNDTLDGGGGNDIALYNGVRADYDVTTTDGVTTIVAKAGDEGTDTLTNVRFLKFKGDDTTLMLSNAAPAQVGLSASSVAENTPTGTTVATVSATDADGDAITYALSDPTGTFRLDGTKLVLVKALDYETGSHQYSLTLTATDAYGAASSRSVTLAVGDVADTPSGGSSGPVSLSLRGTARADRLTGADGNDVLKGLAGNDVLKGLAGNDKLYGGAGKDVLYGGAGQDIFVFDAKFNKTTNLDKIADFNVKDDTIWLENSLFKANKSLYAAIKKGSEAKPLKMASKFFTVGDKAKDADDFFIYDKKTGVLYYDADGSGSKAAVEIATLKKGLKMTDKDFFFV